MIFFAKSGWSASLKCSEKAHRRRADPASLSGLHRRPTLVRSAVCHVRVAVRPAPARPAGLAGKRPPGPARSTASFPKIDGYSQFHELRLAERPYVTIHNGWDNVAHRHTTNATKSWPVSHYERFVAAFEQGPQVLVVQLGAKTSRPIAGIDIGLLDDTTLCMKRHGF